MNGAILQEEFTNEYLNCLNKLSVPKKKHALNYTSVFCGGGGLDLGFSLAGIRPIYSSDLFPVYCETVKQNLCGRGHIVEAHDICDLTGDHVRKVTSKETDIVIGGPPCQSFSILGSRKSTADPRGKLVFEYARFIQELQPSAFLFENVPGIMTINGGADWRGLIGAG